MSFAGSNDCGSCTITAAITSSSPSSVWMATAAHSMTPGYSTTAFSTSKLEMFSPRRRIVSRVRSTT